MKLAIIPAYNEAENIADVIAKTKAQGVAVLVLDDGSTDQTAAVARQAGADVVSNRQNRGLGPTIRRAYQEALARGAEIVVQLDADGQYEPNDIPKLIAPIESGEADMVLGSRLEDLKYKMPGIKKFGNKAFTSVLRKLTGADVKDGQTGFRAIHHTVLERCLPINDFSYTQEMIIRAAKEGFVIKSVPTPFYERYDDQSRLFRSPLSFAFRGWWIIIRTWRDYHPFKFFFWPGFIALLLSLGLAINVAVHLYQTGQISGRLGSLVASGSLLVFGFQMIFVGLLADMIRTHTKY